MSNLWNDRDLPVLRAVVELCEEGERAPIDAVVERTGLDRADVVRSVKLFDASEPAYFTKLLGSMQGPIMVMGVTERAMQRAGFWPTEESGVAALVAALQAAADNEPDEKKKGKLRRIADSILDVGVDLTAKTTAEYLKGTF